MTAKPTDPLLATARILLAIILGFMGLGIAATTIAIPAVLVARAQVLAELAKEGVPPEALGAIVVILALAAGACALGFLFFRNLYRIVSTVGEGDPFVPVNATRLAAMGWIVVAFHALSIPLVGVVKWLDGVMEKAHSDASVSFSGLLLALVLFILARVFREGTRLRDEVEGTV